MSDSPFIFNVDNDSFDKIVLEGSHTTPVLVDFWAAWCNPCQILMPILAKLVDQFQGKFLLAKVDTEEQQALAARFGVRSLPTVKLFMKGQAVDEFMGALPEQAIRTFLDKHIPRESDKRLSEAQALIEKGQLSAATKLIENARTSDPENPRTQVAYARLQAMLGDIADARAILAELPMDEQEKPNIVALRAQLLFDEVARSAPPAESLELLLKSNPDNAEAQYQLAAHKVMDANYEAALELLMTLLQKDRKYGDDAARKGMLAIFDILGGTGDLVARYRARLFNALH